MIPTEKPGPGLLHRSIYFVSLGEHTETHSFKFIHGFAKQMNRNQDTLRFRPGHFSPANTNTILNVSLEDLGNLKCDDKHLYDHDAIHDALAEWLKKHRLKEYNAFIRDPAAHLVVLTNLKVTIQTESEKQVSADLQKRALSAQEKTDRLVESLCRETGLNSTVVAALKELVAMHTSELKSVQDALAEQAADRDGYFGTWYQEDRADVCDNQVTALESLQTDQMLLPRRKAVFSFSNWRSRYEEQSLKTSAQYCAFLLVAYLGDVLFNQTITHNEYRGCAFDFNDDNDSIVKSIKMARICKSCRGKLESADQENLLLAFETLLARIKKPEWHVVWREMPKDSSHKLIVSTLIFGIIVNFMSEYLQSKGIDVASVVIIGLLIIPAGVFLYEWIRPGSKYRNLV